MRIFLDMDGVLADFVQHTANLGIKNNHQWYEPKEQWTEETWHHERIKTDAMHSDGFWLGIPPMPGAKELWDAAHEIAGYDNVYVLTKKPQEDSPDLVSEEKFEWLNTQLGPIDRDHFICMHGSKAPFLDCGDVLVDDDHRHNDGLPEKGAYFIHHADVHQREGDMLIRVTDPNVGGTISQLRELKELS